MAANAAGINSIAGVARSHTTTRLPQSELLSSPPCCGTGRRADCSTVASIATISCS